MLTSGPITIQLMVWFIPRVHPTALYAIKSCSEGSPFGGAAERQLQEPEESSLDKLSVEDLLTELQSAADVEARPHAQGKLSSRWLAARLRG